MDSLFRLMARLRVETSQNAPAAISKVIQGLFKLAVGLADSMGIELARSVIGSASV